MWVGSWAADCPSFTHLSVSLDAYEKAQVMCLSGRSPRFTISVRVPSSAVGNQVLATYLRPHTNVLLLGRTPLFLSRLLTRVPIQSFERWVGGRALGGSRNFEVSPIQSNEFPCLSIPSRLVISCVSRLPYHSTVGITRM
jgi:hypothetical protein